MHFLVLAIFGKYCIRHILCGHSKVVTIFQQYYTERIFKKNNIALIAIQHSKIYFVDTFGDFSHTVE